MKALAAARWAAMRVLYEDARASAAELAAMTGVTESRIISRARRDGWLDPDEETLAEVNRTRLQRELAWWIGRMEQAGSAGTGIGERLDKEEIDAIAAAIRAMEKIDELVKANATKTKKNSDAEKAAVLARVNQRIVELARAFAAEIVAERDAGADADAGAAEPARGEEGGG